MSMYSGIGSFAKRFQDGGEAQNGNGGSGAPPDEGSSGGAGAPMSFEEFVAAYGGNPGGLIGGLAADVAYQAYLQAYNQYGGNVDVTNGNITVKPKTLPDYLRINDAGQVVFVEGVTNRQFVEGLKLLGLLDTEHSEGKTDYDWLTEWFTDTNEGGQSDWLNVHLMDPDRALDYSGIPEDLTSQNKATLRRLYDIVNNASTAGGYFTPSQGFLNEYGTPTTPGQNYGNGTAASRPVFVGQPPTGGTAEQPYYSLSDILVSSSEQPNLYDRFDPYPGSGFSQVNPYVTPVTTQYSYRPPLITPSLVSDTQGATNVTGTVGGADTTTTTTTGTGGETVSRAEIDALYQELFGRNALDAGANYWMGEVASGNVSRAGLRDALIRGAQGSDRDYYQQNVLGGGTTGTTGTTDTTGTTGTTGTTNTTTTTPTAPASGYISFAEAKGLDDYLYGQRDVGYRGDIQALLGSRQDLTAQEFQALLGSQQGRYGEGSTLAYDPRFGIYSTLSEDQLARYQSGEIGYGRGSGRTFDASYLNPNLMSDEDRIRQNMLGWNRGVIRYTDDQGRLFNINMARQRLRIGDKQYIMNPDGTITSYTVRDTPRESGPSFGPYGKTGFADGGIVSIANDFSNMEITGEGIESFLNPERSKATLRRNLAKLAPRPTVPVMQQGIMPMAR